MAKDLFNAAADTVVLISRRPDTTIRNAGSDFAFEATVNGEAHRILVPKTRHDRIALKETLAETEQMEVLRADVVFSRSQISLTVRAEDLVIRG